MANYIYLRQSSEELKEGDLTQYGIFEIIDDHWDSMKLQPLLIMDAPEYSMNKIHYYDDEDLWVQRFKEITSMPSISSLSNEQVYKYLKSKGIKPDTDLLIEFDGEVEVQKECAEYDFCRPIYPDGCPRCNKVAIIKDTEVKRTYTDEEIWKEVLSTRDLNISSLAVNDCLKYFTEKYEIKRRK